MKKIMMLLMVAVLMMGFSSKAMAAFTNGDLIRVVYQDNGSVEVATDLGAFSQTSPITSNIVYSANPFSTSTFGTGFADLYVGYYVYNGSSTTGWTSGLAGQTAAARGGSAFASNAASVNSYYQALAGGASGASQATGSESTTGSYVNNMDKGVNNGTNGLMGGLFAAGNSANNADTSLAALGTVGYVDSVLNYYSSLNGGTGLNIATIQTLSNGTTQLISNVSSVPIPAAIYLLGSGLVGLVGMRRKMAA